MYYSGSGRWSDDSAKKQTYDTQTELESMMANPDGLNGGWRNATIVEE
jgi:hypothetical protein